ncbi:hypothetical protein KFK09_007007 [Dendrobium nobile]|uniref:Uncharacterized protein n=1 Tax=Dendrobium nobile TaxID=94219 RepID=A0A8T3BV47_DENNO|nr:hypothetical protein KFK09_007007 [Dendrobium nobile]
MVNLVNSVKVWSNLAYLGQILRFFQIRPINISSNLQRYPMPYLEHSSIMDGSNSMGFDQDNLEFLSKSLVPSPFF